LGKAEALAEAENVASTMHLAPDTRWPQGSSDSANTFLEAGCLDGLRALLRSGEGSFRAAYIDPPYNTGKSFAYSDRFDRKKEGLDSHSSWLNMIYPPIALCRRLLSDDGTLFVSIDDNEAANMRLILDEIFGEGNRAATFLWTKTATPPSLSAKSRKTVEYIYAYEKRKSALRYYGAPLDGGDAPLLNTSNAQNTLTFPAGSVRFTFCDFLDMPAGLAGRLNLREPLSIRSGVNQGPMIAEGPFKWNQATLDSEIAAGTQLIVKSAKFAIRFLRPDDNLAYKAPDNLLDRSLGVGTNETATKELEAYGLGGLFPYAKPTSLIRALLLMVCHGDKQAKVLDFFAGSATTGEALLQINAMDGGSRRFVLIQPAEALRQSSRATGAAQIGDIASLARERLARCSAKYEGIGLDAGFKAYVLEPDAIRH